MRPGGLRDHEPRIGRNYRDEVAGGGQHGRRWGAAKTSRSWPLEVAVAIGLLLATAVPVIDGGGGAAPGTSEDFHSVATRPVNAGEVQLANLDSPGDGEVRVRKNAKDLGPGELESSSMLSWS